MKVLFVCVNYNGSLFTEKFLASICNLDNALATRSFALSVIVVDNASGDEDKLLLGSIVGKYEFAKVVYSEVNLGYFPGLNLGLSSVILTDYDYIVAGNNDLCFDRSFLFNLSSREYSLDTLVVAPNVIASDSYSQNPHCITRVSRVRRFLYLIYFSNYYFAVWLVRASRLWQKLRGGRRNKSASKSMYIHMGIGACYILTPSFFRHFSILPDLVFLYGEEALLAAQVLSVGGKTYYDSTLRVHHAESATLSKVPKRTSYEFGKKSYKIYRKYL